MSEETSLKDHVENQILKYTFHAKNFTKEEMDAVDDYCKKVYDNNRKLMIFDLIRYKEENIIANILNEKIESVYITLKEEIDSLKDKDNINKQEITKPTWKGFKRE